MLYFAAVLVIMALVAARDRRARRPERGSAVFRFARADRRRPHWGWL